MSAQDIAPPAANEAARLRVKRYVIGLLLALLLTGAAFGSVAWGGLSSAVTLAVIVALAIVQSIVHLVFFLDIARRGSGIEIRAALLFGAVLAMIMVGGTIAIMGDLAHRMMMSH